MRKTADMMDEHFFADVDLPFHVWVRETSGGKARWVLRETSALQGESQGGTATAHNPVTSPRPSGP